MCCRMSGTTYLFKFSTTHLFKFRTKQAKVQSDMIVDVSAAAHFDPENLDTNVRVTWV